MRLQGVSDADDLTGDVFLSVFAGLDRFDGSEQQFRSWVFTIAHHRLVDERRRVARRRWVVTDQTELLDRPGGDVEQEAVDNLASQRVRQLCAELSDDQREVLLLRIVADLSPDEVAVVLGKSVGAVRALQHRALSALRRQIAWKGVAL